MYEPVRPPFSLHFDRMSKDELRAYFEWFRASIPERIRQLELAVRSAVGFESWTANGTPASLIALGEWFLMAVTTRERTASERKAVASRLVFPVDIDTSTLTDETYSFAFDVGLYFSQVLMLMCPTLKWHQELGRKKFIDYGQPVLVEFSTAPFNPPRMMIVLALGLVDGTYAGGRLHELFEIWSKLVVDGGQAMRKH